MRPCRLGLVGAGSLLLVVLGNGCAGITPRPDHADAEFRRLADHIVQAVRDKDTEPLLALSRPGLEDFDHMGMHPGHPLYCFVFDTACMQWGTRSVYDLVTGAQDLRVKTTVVSGDGGKRSGLLELFDRVVVDENRLESLDYFCAHWNREVITWTFEYDGRAWRSAHPIFDQYIDVFCSPDAIRSGVGRLHVGLGAPVRDLQLNE